MNRWGEKNGTNSSKGAWMKKNGWSNGNDKLKFAKMKCKGKETLTTKCREAFYRKLDRNNDLEWAIAIDKWWNGIPWLVIFGIFNWIMFPFKMVIIALVPELNPKVTTNYN
jgi:hypothetical protein